MAVNALARQPQPNALAPADPWVAQMQAAYARNKAWAKPGENYQTVLPPQEEASFRQWLAQNKVPFRPDDPVVDYDMRGYWRDQGQLGSAGTAVNPNDGQLHYPDTYKTPYHQSFSAESRYALPTAPMWANDHQLVDRRTGRVIFDERAKGR